MRKIFVDSRSNIWLLGATYGIMKADSITVALKTQNGLYASEFGYPINNVDFAKLFANNYKADHLKVCIMPLLLIPVFYKRSTILMIW